jgi:hypothetical protein
MSDPANMPVFPDVAQQAVTMDPQDGFVHSIYTVLRPDLKAPRTIEYPAMQGWKVLLDVGADGKPVAVQLLAAPTP